MKVTNTTPVVQKVRGADGVVEIQAGRSRVMEFDDATLARVRQRTGIVLDEPTPAKPGRKAGADKSEPEKAI